MSNDNYFLMLDQPCEKAVEWVLERLSQASLSVLRTFDLQMARHAHTVCPCPHHGTDHCDCQMVVLLVYQVNRLPITLIAHGYGQQTWFSVVDTPQQRVDPHIEAVIRRILAPAFPISTNLSSQAQVI